MSERNYVFIFDVGFVDSIVGCGRYQKLMTNAVNELRLSDEVSDEI